MATVQPADPARSGPMRTVIVARTLNVVPGKTRMAVGGATDQRPQAVVARMARFLMEAVVGQSQNVSRFGAFLRNAGR